MTRGSTELFDCSRVNDYLESYLSGQVPPPERRGMRLHIHGCPECHRMVMERDPLQFFAPLADQERDGSWDGFYDAIRAGITVDTRRLRPVRRRLWLSAAAAVLVVVTMGAVGFYVVVNRARPPIVATETLPPPAAQAVSSAGPWPQTVERVRGTGAGQVQVYTMNYYQDESAGQSADRGSGAKHGQTAELVLIVDARLEL